MDLDKVTANIRFLLTHCGTLILGECLCILYDATTQDIASAFYQEACSLTDSLLLVEVPVATRHGQEPSKEVIAKMCNADLIIALSRFSLAHSQARLEAGKHGARFLSLPFYTWELLEDPAVAFPFKIQAPIVHHIANIFTAGKKVHVTTRAGTDITLNIDGRVGNACPGFVEQPGDLGSPPDIEANISPLEDDSEGIIVVDGSITTPELGLVPSPITLIVERGRVVKFISKENRWVMILEKIFGTPFSGRRILAECGVGLNPSAQLTGTMLTDEGALGCLHFGFGANNTVGGKNQVDFHLDFVLKSASLSVDRKAILQEGKVIV